MNHFEFVAWQNMQKNMHYAATVSLGARQNRKKNSCLYNVDKHCQPLKYLTKIFLWFATRQGWGMDIFWKHFGAVRLNDGNLHQLLTTLGPDLVSSAHSRKCVKGVLYIYFLEQWDS